MGPRPRIGRRDLRRGERGRAGREPEEEGEVTITPEQVKTARQLLGWTPAKLSRRVGATEKAIRAFEGRHCYVAILERDAARAALTREGWIHQVVQGEGEPVTADEWRSVFHGSPLDREVRFAP